MLPLPGSYAEPPAPVNPDRPKRIAWGTVLSDRRPWRVEIFAKADHPAEDRELEMGSELAFEFGKPAVEHGPALVPAFVRLSAVDDDRFLQGLLSAARNEDEFWVRVHGPRPTWGVLGAPDAPAPEDRTWWVTGFVRAQTVRRAYSGETQLPVTEFAVYDGLSGVGGQKLPETWAKRTVGQILTAALARLDPHKRVLYAAGLALGDGVSPPPGGASPERLGVRAGYVVPGAVDKRLEALAASLGCRLLQDPLTAAWVFERNGAQGRPLPAGVVFETAGGAAPWAGSELPPDVWQITGEPVGDEAELVLLRALDGVEVSREFEPVKPEATATPPPTEGLGRPALLSVLTGGGDPDALPAVTSGAPTLAADDPGGPDALATGSDRGFVLWSGSGTGGLRWTSALLGEGQLVRPRIFTRGRQDSAGTAEWRLDGRMVLDGIDGRRWVLDAGAWVETAAAAPVSLVVDASPSYSAAGEYTGWLGAGVGVADLEDSAVVRTPELYNNTLARFEVPRYDGYEGAFNVGWFENAPNKPKAWQAGEYPSWQTTGVEADFGFKTGLPDERRVRLTFDGKTHDGQHQQFAVTRRPLDGLGAFLGIPSGQMFARLFVERPPYYGSLELAFYYGAPSGSGGARAGGRPVNGLLQTAAVTVPNDVDTWTLSVRYKGPLAAKLSEDPVEPFYLGDGGRARGFLPPALPAAGTVTVEWRTAGDGDLDRVEVRGVALGLGKDGADADWTAVVKAGGRDLEDPVIESVDSFLAPVELGRDGVLERLAPAATSVQDGRTTDLLRGAQELELALAVARDRVEQREADVWCLEGTIAGAMGPRTRLDLPEGEYVPVGLVVKAAPFEETQGVWRRLPSPYATGLRLPDPEPGA